MNNAANALAQPLGGFTADAWAKSFDVNLRGPVFLVQEALPHLKESPHAAVLNVISAGAFLFSAFVAMYAAGKAALMSLHPGHGRRVRPRGIRVNALAPGHGRHRHGARPTRPRPRSAMANACSCGASRHPDEMVGPALLLTSDAGSFITGQCSSPTAASSPTSRRHTRTADVLARSAGKNIGSSGSRAVTRSSQSTTSGWTSSRLVSLSSSCRASA